jgi:predicted aspartyl protease
MITEEVKRVGRFSVEIELSNYEDVAAARRGERKPAEIRRVKIDGLVDSGATRLVLPEAVVKKLGLPATGKVKVTYANGRSATRDTVDGVYLEMMGRHGTFSASVEPKRETALIGAIVLEDLDFLIDPKNNRLYPRDPNIVISEAE